MGAGDGFERDMNVGDLKPGDIIRLAHSAGQPRLGTGRTAVVLSVSGNSALVVTPQTISRCNGDDERITLGSEVIDLGSFLEDDAWNGFCTELGRLAREADQAAEVAAHVEGEFGDSHNGGWGI